VPSCGFEVAIDACLLLGNNDHALLAPTQSMQIPALPPPLCLGRLPGPVRCPPVGLPGSHGACQVRKDAAGCPAAFTCSEQIAWQPCRLRNSFFADWKVTQVPVQAEAVGAHGAEQAKGGSGDGAPHPPHQPRLWAREPASHACLGAGRGRSQAELTPGTPGVSAINAFAHRQSTAVADTTS
jgi:hypothetical protein